MYRILEIVLKNIGRYKKMRLKQESGTNFCDYNGNFYKKLSLGPILHYENG